MKLKHFLGIILLVLFGLSSCQKSENVKTIAAEEFQKMLSVNADVIVLDVRTPEEFSAGRLENAININYYDKDFKNQIDDLDKSKKVFVYCKSGGRSSGAAEILAKQGFAEIVELKGGLLTWQANDMPLVGVAKKVQVQYTLSNYQKLMSEGDLVLIDFYADWCGPCKMMDPHIKRLKKELDGKLKVFKVDTDKSLELVKHFNINGIPRLRLYHKGENVYDKTGFHDYDQLKELVKDYL
jgi:thioredoxin